MGQPSSVWSSKGEPGRLLDVLVLLIELEVGYAVVCGKFGSRAVAMMAISKTNFTDVVLRATIRLVIVALQS